MTEVIITTAGTALTSLIGILITNRLSNYRIGQLEEKVSKHNNLVERMYKAEGDIRTICTEIRDIKEERR